MKAIMYAEYGSPDVLQLKEIAQPVPAVDEVLVKVRAAAVNAADWRLMRADPFLARLYNGWFRPRRITTLGCDIAGVVEAVGQQVERFKPGDEVFGNVFASNFGGFAEYKCAREQELVRKPSMLSFEEAAAVPLAGITALHALREAGQIQPGQRVLINGASGGVGTFAIQLAKYFGAEVTAVCSTGKMKMARGLGADHVIDYTHEDFIRNGRRYELIIAANGSRSIFDYRRALSSNGTYVMSGGNNVQLFQAILLGPLLFSFGKKTRRVVSAVANQKDLILLKELLESGRLTPVIEKNYPLEQTADAVRHVEQGHAAGKVVISIG